MPKLPNSLRFLSLTGTGVKCLPNYLSNLVVITNALIPSLCNPTNNPYHCSAYPTVMGKVFGDNNSNGIKDKDEYYIPFIRANLNTGESAFSNYEGQFSITASDTGRFRLRVQPSAFYKAVPDSSSFGLNDYNTILTLPDIALQPTIVKDSLDIHIYPLETPVPGKKLLYSIGTRNIGTTNANATVSFTYDSSRLVFDAASVPLTSHVGNTLAWQDTLSANYFDNYFFRGNYHFPYLSFTVKKTALAGDSLKATATVTSTKAKATASINTLIRGSYDPNFKQATPQLTITQVKNGEWIDYIIHFQNVGTAEASNVVISDTLSTMLNPGYLQMIACSHNPMITLVNNVIYFQFLGINLPDSGSNQVQSNGFIHFRLKPQLTVTAGTDIYNNASIYFDYNSPVLTNNAATLIKGVILPVSIVSYQLQHLASGIANNWVTTREINTAYFNIQRSTDGRNFATIGKTTATGGGFYTFTDAHAADALAQNSTLYYRLQVVGKDGTISYSETKSINTQPLAPSISIYPNPAKNFILVDGKNINQINIMDNMGKVVAAKAGLNILATQNRLDFNLPRGVYVVQIATADGKIANQKFVVE
ncbi:T9SS type A sorting domain-containing protein [Parasediminibacterium sp. JCM 36343]|uniref:DUF7619 domain-containing protein n=1 Tax=Parasediminibacterium sp. JCM 36343 TaxID=3374279 RepID=UPI00397C9F78